MPITQQDLSLNEYLFPNSAPIAAASEAVSGFSVQQNFERDAITAAKIRTINANQINAGTVTVGINLGSTVSGAYVKLDGANNRIVLNDGTVTRIIIGSV